MKLCGIYILLSSMLYVSVQAQVNVLPVKRNNINMDSLFAVPVSPLNGKTVHLVVSDSRPTVFYFLSPECPLCLNYSKSINELYKEFSGKIDFIGLFPGKSYSKKEIGRFITDYSIKIPVYSDRVFGVSRLMNATVTPEVVMINAAGNILYRGAIDDWIISLGKKKEKPTIFYLKNAIIQFLENTPVVTTSTKPVGCYINDY